MKKRYLIVFETLHSNDTHRAVVRELSKFEDSARLLSKVWVLKSAKSLSGLRNQLWKMLRSGDCLYITEINPETSINDGFPEVDYL
jgi:hypothetical protein